MAQEQTFQPDATQRYYIVKIVHEESVTTMKGD